MGNQATKGKRDPSSNEAGNPLSLKPALKDRPTIMGAKEILDAEPGADIGGGTIIIDNEEGSEKVQLLSDENESGASAREENMEDSPKYTDNGDTIQLKETVTVNVDNVKNLFEEQRSTYGEGKSSDQLEEEARKLVMSASLVLQAAHGKRHQENLQKLNAMQAYYEKKIEDKSKELQDRVENKHTALLAEIGKKTNENTVLQETIIQLKSKLNEMSMEKDQVHHERLEKSSSEIAGLKDEIARLLKIHENNKLKFEKMKQRNDFLQAQVNKREVDYVEKSRAVDKLEDELRQDREDMMRMRSELDQSINREAMLKSKYQDLLTEHTTLCENIGNLTGGIGMAVNRSMKRKETLNNESNMDGRRNQDISFGR